MSALSRRAEPGFESPSAYLHESRSGWAGKRSSSKEGDDAYEWRSLSANGEGTVFFREFKNARDSIGEGVLAVLFFGGRVVCVCHGPCLGNVVHRSGIATWM